MNDHDFDLTTEEMRVIAGLKRIAKKWPRSLWLFSAAGTLAVMRCDDNGNHAHTAGGGVDPEYVVDHIDIDNDGGDW